MRIIGKKTTPKEGIYSSEKSSHWILVGFGFVFIAFSVPILWSLSSELEKGDNGVLIALIFPLLGVFMSYQGFKRRRNFVFFGPTPLIPSPKIGQVGGQIGGSVDIAQPWGQRTLSVQLSCLHIYTTGSNDNRSTHTDILWQEISQPYDQPSGAGSRLEFCFDVPSDQPIDGTHSGRGNIHWEVMIEGEIKGHKFKRHWGIPVEKGEYLSKIIIPAVHTQSVKAEQKEQAEQSVSQQIHTTVTQNGLEIVSEQGRNKSMSIGLTLFGLMFLGAGIFLTIQALNEGMMLWLMAPIFLLVGGSVFLFGLFLMGRKLECKIIDGMVYVRRSVFGVVIYRHQGEITDADQIYLKKTMSSQQGSKRTEYMAVFAKVNGDDGTTKKLKLVEGIKEKRAGEAMLEQIKLLFKA